MEKPTTGNQQKQIIKNSRAIGSLLKAYNKNIVYTDYQLASSDALNRNAWVNVPLTNVEFWQPVMRPIYSNPEYEDDNVREDGFEYTLRHGQFY